MSLGQHEKVGDDWYAHPKMLSRWYPVKLMFMGVVGRPVPHRNFDGKIFLERVSERKYISKCTAHTNLSDDALVNAEIKNCEWRKLVYDLNLHLSDLKGIFKETYALGEAIVDRLKFFILPK